MVWGVHFGIIPAPLIDPSHPPLNKSVTAQGLGFSHGILSVEPFPSSFSVAYPVDRRWLNGSAFLVAVEVGTWTVPFMGPHESRHGQAFLRAWNQ